MNLVCFNVFPLEPSGLDLRPKGVPVTEHRQVVVLPHLPVPLLTRAGGYGELYVIWKKLYYAPFPLCGALSGEDVPFFAQDMCGPMSPQPTCAVTAIP